MPMPGERAIFAPLPFHSSAMAVPRRCTISSSHEEATVSAEGHLLDCEPARRHRFEAIDKPKLRTSNRAHCAALNKLSVPLRRLTEETRSHASLVPYLRALAPVAFDVVVGASPRQRLVEIEAKSPENPVCKGSKRGH